MRIKKPSMYFRSTNYILILMSGIGQKQMQFQIQYYQ